MGPSGWVQREESPVLNGMGEPTGWDPVGRPKEKEQGLRTDPWVLAMPEAWELRRGVERGWGWGKPGRPGCCVLGEVRSECGRVRVVAGSQAGRGQVEDGKREVAGGLTGKVGGVPPQVGLRKPSRPPAPTLSWPYPGCHWLSGRALVNPREPSGQQPWDTPHLAMDRWVLQGSWDGEGVCQAGVLQE